MMFRYWVLDGKEYRSKRPFVSKVLLLFIVVSISLFFLVKLFNKFGYEFENVDHTIIQMILKGNVPVIAWVYTWETANIPKNLIVKEWRFDTFKILFVEIYTLDELKVIAENSWYVGTVSGFVIKPPEIPIEIKIEDVQKAKTRNYAFEIHNPFLKYTGKGITIAVLDTGIDYLLPIFYKNCNNSTTRNVKIKALISFIVRVNNKPIIWRFDWYLKGLNTSLTLLKKWEDDVFLEIGVYPFFDLIGHGTSVSALINSEPNCYINGFSGIAPNVNLVVIKIFPDNVTTGLDVILDALHWIYYHYREYNISVISMSLNVYAPAWGEFSNPINIVLDALVKKGIAIFIACGNEGNYPGTLNNVGISKNVFTVGAWDPIHHKIASFTSLPTLGQKPIDFLAVGYLVWTVLPKESMLYITIKKYYPQLIIDDDKGLVLMLGTSYSTPIVASIYATWYEWFIENIRKKPTIGEISYLMCTKGYLTGKIPEIVRCGLIKAPS